jgi:plastocyanin
LVLGGAVGCAEKGPSVPPEQPLPGDVVVRLVGLEFEPKEVTVPAGRRVFWQWTDSVVHNVVAKDFSSKNLGGGSYAVPFPTAGRHEYKCTLHPGMDGVVVVTP